MTTDCIHAPGPDSQGPSALKGPAFPGRIGYVLLWFPLSSETFIFREVKQLAAFGVDVPVYTVYAARRRGQSGEMRSYDGPVTHMGLAALPAILTAFLHELRRRPRFVWQLMRSLLFRRMRNLESLAENTWSFFAGFHLANLARRDRLGLLHSGWANGPATTALVASRLTDIPFAFTGRAGDIYPQDGLLPEKIHAAAFVRTNNAADVTWLSRFCAKEEAAKIHLIYNSLTLTSLTTCECPCRPPYRLLSVGRFARTKGFPYLLTAVARLRREHFPVHLTLIGDGSWRNRLTAMVKRLGLEAYVDMPGFIPHDNMLTFMQTHDMMIVPSVVHTNGDRDGIPNVIMEALSNGMPVIATDVCGIREVIRNGETGILLPQRDAAAIADAIRWMASHREEALKMADSGRQLVQRLFCAETNIRKLATLYASIFGCDLSGKALGTSPSSAADTLSTIEETNS